MEQLQFSLVLVADAHSFGHAVALSITLAWLALATEKVAVCAGMLQLANILRIAFRELDDLALVTASDRPRAAPCFHVIPLISASTSPFELTENIKTRAARAG